ncbi:MAG: type II secretion system F family protein [Actinobacteria bacterium]|nr:type II secretion system F family protein [Actinomycetota bacterium]
MTVPIPLLATAWALLAVAGLWPRRPQVRVPVPVGGSRSAPARRRARRAPTLSRPVLALGRVVGRAGRALTGRPADPAGDFRRGVVVAATGAVLVVAPLLVPVPALVAWALPRVRARQARRTAESAMLAELVHVADLLVLAFGAGLTVPLALDLVGERASGPVGRGLGAAQRRAALGQALPDELERAAAALGSDARRLANLLAGALRTGAPLLDPLERLGAELRADQRRAAEERARRLPVRMLFPLVLCLLPAFVVLTVVPVLLSAMGRLGV